LHCLQRPDKERLRLEKFAFIIHPIDARRDVSRHPKYRFAKYLPERAVEWIIKHKSPQVASHITGVRSITGVEAEGWFIVCPLTPRQMLSLPIELVYKRLIESGKIAEGLGAKILGLGAFTSIVGDGGVTIADNLNIAVTTGNSYTVQTALEATVDGARRMEIEIGDAKVAVVGATGSIGRVCAEVLGAQSGRLSVIGRDTGRLEEAVSTFDAATQSKTTIHTDIREGLAGADIIVTVTSAVDVVIQPEFLKPGCVVTDVARPRDVSVRVAKERDDVLIIEGGVVKVPGEPQFRFNFGFPPGMAYACMSETMMLALDGRYESLTLGKTVNIDQVNTTKALAAKHGFTLAGYRSFEREVTDAQIEAIRKRAGLKRAGGRLIQSPHKSPASV
jgi:fatty aldehyde-generating acyl-ACP reductase